MKPLRAGKLRHRVTIEEANPETVSADGQPLPQWVTLTERWASVEPIETSGREYLRAQAIQADVTHTVTLRYLAGVTPKNRVQHKGRMLEIQSVSDIEERGRMLVLFCKEKV
ncbi:MAG TPA: phage head closure protein [Tepidisphaeraceae bacterium]|nr:phage head closure protein [Tepidisphaeraceae bacterium]